MKKAKIYHKYKTCQFYRQVKPTKHASRKLRLSESELDSETDTQQTDEEDALHMQENNPEKGCVRMKEHP